jgi:hypothetical protein
VRHVLRSSDLLRVEANWISVFQSGIRTGACTMAGGPCGTIAEVASSTS